MKKFCVRLTLFSVILDLLVSVRKLVKMLSYENNFLDKLICISCPDHPLAIFDISDNSFASMQILKNIFLKNFAFL